MSPNEHFKAKISGAGSLAGIRWELESFPLGELSEPSGKLLGQAIRVMDLHVLYDFSTYYGEDFYAGLKENSFFREKKRGIVEGILTGKESGAEGNISELAPHFKFLKGMIEEGMLKGERELSLQVTEWLKRDRIEDDQFYEWSQKAGSLGGVNLHEVFDLLELTQADVIDYFSYEYPYETGMKLAPVIRHPNAPREKLLDKLISENPGEYWAVIALRDIPESLERPDARKLIRETLATAHPNSPWMQEMFFRLCLHDETTEELNHDFKILTGINASRIVDLHREMEMFQVDLLEKEALLPLLKNEVGEVRKAAMLMLGHIERRQDSEKTAARGRQI